MLWTLIVFLGLGVVLLVVGLWPRRVGQAPHCRRCGFDLSGVAGLEADSAEQASGCVEHERCPECGRALSAPRAVATGRLQRRRRLALAGLLLVLLPGGLSIPIATGHWTAWNTSKPVWILSLDTDLGNDAIQTEALTELRRRELAGTLDRAGKWALLHAQAAGLGRGPGLDLSDLPAVQLAYENSELSQARWDDTVQSLDQAVQQFVDRMHMPERVGLVRSPEGELIGEQLWPKYQSGPGPAGGLGVLLLHELQELRIDGEMVEQQPLERDVGKTPPQNYVILGNRGWMSSTLREIPGRDAVHIGSVVHGLAGLGPGEYEVETSWQMTPFIDAGLTTRTPSAEIFASGTWLATRRLTFTTTILIEESSPSLIRPVTDPEQLASMQQYFTLNSLEERAWNPMPTDPAVSVPFYLSSSWGSGSAADIAMVGNLEFEWNGQRVRPSPTPGTPAGIPGIQLEAIRETLKNGGMGRTLYAPPPDPLPSTVTVIFVPDLAAAPDYAGPWIVQREGPMPVVAEEIRWENIPVRWRAERVVEPEEDSSRPGEHVGADP